MNRKFDSSAHRPLRLRIASAFALLPFLAGALASVLAQEVSFNRDVRPLLADKCFQCHGPDAASRVADLRFDDRQYATANLGGYHAIVAGDVVASELLVRVQSLDTSLRMPPPETGEPLTEAEIEILHRWIAAGAEYETHWSFTPTERPELPSVSDSAWPRNAIDTFVLARMNSIGWKPADDADPATKIRRVTLDLTGLPPTPEQVQAFEGATIGDAAAAYQGLVDELLASPDFAERMASQWLDAARYADTHGYFTDEDRTMWPWRDWVVSAINDNMPFDQFTIEQIAGDLLPNATLDQKVASGFHRNHMINNETGIIEEEFRLEYVADRVDTTATVWMGLTVACARCHDHKFDPISQREFYQLSAFFNHVPEQGLSGSSGNSAPLLTVANAGQMLELERVTQERASAQLAFEAMKASLDHAQSQWESSVSTDFPETWFTPVPWRWSGDESASASDSEFTKTTSGIVGDALKFDGQENPEFSNVGDFDLDQPFSVSVWVQGSSGCIVSKMDDAQQMRGWDLTLRKGKLTFHLVGQWGRNAIAVSTQDELSLGSWRHIAMAYDGSGKAAGIKLYFDGKQQSLAIDQDHLSETIRNHQPLRIGRRQSSESYSGAIDELQLYDRVLSSEEVDRLMASQLVRGITNRSIDQRNSTHRAMLQTFYLTHHADPSFVSASRQLDRCIAREQQLLSEIPTTMVMQDVLPSRETFVLLRGEYDQRGEKVLSGYPAALTTSVVSEKKHETRTLEQEQSTERLNRLDLARWLVGRSHPLTARVTVNRIWQQYFGVGIVKTADDFGIQGEWPSHKDLLDWLAVEFMDSGWDVKHLVRQIVTSRTYQQASDFNQPWAAEDPENRWLSRGPRLRMDAEVLRDSALSASQLLVRRVGGPPVFPFQPGGLWEAVSYDSNRRYEPSAGEGLYRRSLYTFWKRQSPPPNMLVFDAPTRDTCTVQRSRTNTPLQSLALMNDPTLVEAARQLATQIVRTSEDEPRRIEHLFRATTSRRPTADETLVVLEFLKQQRLHFQAAPIAAQQLVAAGSTPVDTALDVIELAAWTTAASILLSLDEAISKP